MRKLAASVGIRVGLSAVAFFLLFWFVDLSSGLQALRSAAPLMCIGGFAAFFSGQLVAAFRWRWVLASQGYRLPYLRVLRANMVGSYASMFLPGISGGDVVRPLVLKRGDDMAKSLLYATVAFERLMGMVVLLLFAISGLMLVAAKEGNSVYVIPAAIVSAGILAFIALVLAPLERTALARTVFGRIHASLARFIAGLRTILRNPRLVVGTLVLSALFQLCMIGMYVFMLYAVSAEVKPVVLLLIPIAWIASAAPISINGMGVREGVLVFILAQHGVDQGAATAAAILGVLPMVLYASVGGMLLPADMRKRGKRREDRKPDS